MKFALLVLLAAGALSAPFNSKWETEEIIGLDDFKPKAHHLSLFEEESSCGGKLHTGRVYEFSYVGETENKIQGSSPDATGLQMQAQITIRSGLDCAFSLQVKEAKLLMKSKSQRTYVPAVETAKFSSEMMANELKFKITRGSIASVYAEADEPTHILNIKRGMLSTLQLTNNKEEVDVNGRCHFTLDTVEGAVIKSKNLSKCTERAHNEMGFQSTSIEGEATIINPLNSTSVCKYIFGNGGKEVSTVRCTEEHIFRPFSSGFKTTAGAINTVRQTLKLITAYGKPAITMKVGEPTTLIFDNGKEDLKPVNTIVNEVDQIMHRLVDQSQELGMLAKRDSAHEFTRLVMLLRRLDRKRMIPIWSKYMDCVKSKVCESKENLAEVYRQYLLDALTYCGTTTCVTMVHNVIIENTVSGEHMNMFLQGISLVKRPTKGMVRDLTNIVRIRPSRQAYLSLGTLIFRYCKMFPEECKFDSANPVTQAELLLEEKLGQTCEGQEDANRIEELLLTIKSVGNAGRPLRLWPTLLSCAMASTHQNISLAAFEALRRMPCQDSTTSRLIDMLENVDLDPERRIASYISVMRCPTESTLKRITGMLSKEESRQVSSFIYTHLSNMNESSNPEHASTKKMLSNALNGRQLRVVDLPRTMFSRSYEGSLFNEYLNSGAAVDGHIVYHPDSYLPRTTLLNVTAKVLGVSLNVLELKARMEGFETLIEDVFGADGYYPNSHIMNLFSKTFFNDERIAMLKTRNRRSAAASMEENISDLHQRAGVKRPVPSGHVSMKMFGQEMRLFSYDDIFYSIDQIDNMNVIELLLKLAKGGQKTFTKSVMFLELIHTVPTGLGLPLKVKLLGSAVGSVRVDGKFDIRNMFWGPGSMEMKGALHPSAVVEVSGQMGIHGHFIETGVFVNASMFTSHVVQGSVNYKAGQVLKVNIDTPEDPMEVFNVSVSPFMYINEESTLIEGVPRRVSPSWCMNSTRMTGLGICTSFAVPLGYREYEAPFFPLSGPAHFGMKVVRADPKLTTYQWLISLKKDHNKKQGVGQFVFSTPGATYERKFVGEVRYLVTKMYSTIGFANLQGDKKSEVTFSYNNNTNAMEATFESNMWTPKMFKSKVALTNDTFFKTRQLGVKFVTEYDWYKFQHVALLVNKTNSYMLHSKTTYYPGKHLTGEIEFYPKIRNVAIRLDANQLNQRLEFHGTFVNSSDTVGMNFSAHHLSLDKSAHFFVGYTNGMSSKRLVVNGTVLGKSAESSLGYYVNSLGREVRMELFAMGKKAGMFANCSSETLTKNMDFGLFYQAYRVGGKISAESMNNRRSVCYTVFYGQQRPASVCLNSTVAQSAGDPSSALMSWRLLGYVASLNMDYQHADGSYKFNTSAIYNNKVLLNNNWRFVYNSLFDTELAMNTSVLNRSVGLKWFVNKPLDHITVFGIEGHALNKLVSLTSSYHREQTGEAVTYGLIFEASINKKKLPGNITLLFENAKDLKGVGLVGKLWTYEAKKNIMWMMPKDREHSLVSLLSLTKGNFVVLSKKHSLLLLLGESEKALKYTHSLVVLEKHFGYGWDMVYRNSSTLSKSAHSVSAGLTYSKGRRVSTTFTFANGAKAAELLVDVEYLPRKQLAHVIRFDKELKTLKIAVEFLPKMFATVRGALDRTEGFKVTTNLEFSWKNFNRLFHFAGGLANKTDSYKLFSRISGYGRSIVALTEFDKKTKSGSASITIDGKAIAVVYSNLSAKKNVALVYGQRTVVEAELEQNHGRFVFEVRTPSRSLLKNIAKKDLVQGIYSNEVVVLGKSIMMHEFYLKKSEETAAYHLSLLGVKRMELTSKLNKKAKSVFLHGSLMKNGWDLGIAGKWDDDKNAVTVSVEVANKVFGFIARAHPSKLVSSFHMFYDSRIISGWHIYADRDLNAIVFNVTVTPSLSYQMVSEVSDDHVLKTTLQWKKGNVIINETTFSYVLSADESKFMLEWNKETIEAIKSIWRHRLVPSLKNITVWACNKSQWARNATSDSTLAGKEFLIKAVSNMTKFIFNNTNRLDELFDEFDFVAARDNIGAGIVSVLKRSSHLAHSSMETATLYLKKAHHYTPVVMSYTRSAVATALNHHSKLSNVVYLVVKNITESGKPIIQTAFKLAKEFRIRNRPMQVIVTDFVKIANKSIISFVREVQARGRVYVTILVAKARQTTIPYTSKTVGQVVDSAMQKVKQHTENFNMSKAVEDATLFVLQSKLNGTSIQDHLVIIKGHFVELPENAKIALKKTISSLVKSYELYRSKMEEGITLANVFATPLVNHLKQVNASIYKRFGPLYLKALSTLQRMVLNECMQVYSRYSSLVKEFTMAKYSVASVFINPIITPFAPFAQNVLDQINSLRIVDKELGHLVSKARVSMLSFYVSSWESIRAQATEKVAKLQGNAKMIRSMTAEELVDKVIDSLVVLLKSSSTRMSNLYNNAEQIKLRVSEKVKMMRQSVEEVYSEMALHTPGEWIEIAFENSGKRFMKTVMELSKISNQLSQINLAEPAWQLWKEIDIIAHLDRYGVNGKLDEMLATAKEQNLTEVILSIAGLSKNGTITAINMTVQKINRTITMMKYVASVLRAIPKKSFDDFYADLVKIIFYGKHLAIRQIRSSYDQYSKSIHKLVDATNSSYLAFFNKYVVPTKHWYSIVKNGAVLVYADNKDDTVRVYNFYKDIIVDYYNVKAGAVKEEAIQRFNLAKKYAEDLVAKYDHLTWEEVGMMTSDYLEKRSVSARNLAKSHCDNVKVYISKAIVIGKEAYKNATIKIKEAVVYLNTTARPIVMRHYLLSVSRARNMYKQCVARCMLAYEDVQVRCLQWYINNKSKTIAELYNEYRTSAAAFTTEQINKLNNTARALYIKWSKNFNERLEVILPEVAKEGESIINQTLYAAVVLANETAKAYHPHYSLAKSAVINVSKVIVEKAVVTWKVTREVVQQRSAELKNNGTMLVNKLRVHPALLRVVNSPIVKNLTVKYYQVVAQIENLIKELKQYVQVMKVNPTVVKMKAMIVEYKQQLNAYLEKIKEYEQHPTVVVVKQQMGLAKASALFTWNKVYPIVESALLAYKVQAKNMYDNGVGYATKHSSMFRRQPAECFWVNVANVKTIVNSARSQQVALLNQDPQIIKANVYQWLVDNTDEHAKIMARKAKSAVADCKARALATPAYLKERVQLVRVWIQSAYVNSSKSFTRCPIHAVVTNPIWEELKDEVYEIADIEGAKAILAEKYAAFKTKCQLARAELKNKVEKLRSAMQEQATIVKTKLNKLVHEVTVEDIVLRTVETSLSAYSKAKDMKMKSFEKIVEMRARLNNTLRQYFATARVFLADAKATARKQLEVMIKKVDQYYPISSIDYDLYYKQALENIKQAREQLVQYIRQLRLGLARFAVELKQNITLKVEQKWENCLLRKQFLAAKKMTIRQTIEAGKKMMKTIPNDVAVLARKARSAVVLRADHLNKTYVAPVVAVVKTVVLAVTHEVNETAVFIYRYYGVREKTIRFANYTMDSIVLALPKVVTYVKSSIMNSTNSTLRYLHRSTVAIDNFDYRQHVPDFTKYSNALKNYVNQFSQYINVDGENALVSVRIPHLRSVKPTFSENAAVVNFTVRTYIGKANDTVHRFLNVTKASAKKMYSMVMNATTEIRSDVNTILTINRDVAGHFYRVGVKYSRAVFNSTANATAKWIDETTIEAVKLRKMLTLKANAAFYSASLVYDEVYFRSGSWDEVYSKSKNYYLEVEAEALSTLSNYYNELKEKSAVVYSQQRKSYEKLLKELKPYFELLKISVKRLRSGEKLESAFREIIQIIRKYRSQMEDSVMQAIDENIATLSAKYPVSADMLKKYVSAHSTVMQKYASRASLMYRNNKVRLERIIRQMRYKCGGLANQAMKIAPTRKSFAMVYGYNHVMTFDKKFFEFPKYVNNKCTYLLAGDFQQKNFTIVSQKDKLIILTPDMKVSIHQNGEVDTVVKVVKKGYVRQETFKGLPVQSASGTCRKVMKASLISCRFSQGVVVRCDPKHFVCTIKLNSFNYGKSKGILGTNNNEPFDEYTTPEGVVTSSINKFAASWEVSGDASCSNPTGDNIPVPCNQAPSRRCYDLFQSNTSRFARFFNGVDPRPFLKACAIDTSDCDHNKPYETSHCNSTAAYVAMLRMSGFRGVKTTKDCMSYTTEDGKVHGAMERWTQSASKDADVTVLVSERSYLQGLSKVYAQLMYATHKSLSRKGFSARYSLVGYGGNGVHEAAHVHTMAGQNSNSIFELADTLKTMPYTGLANDTNDAMHAVVMASTDIAYRPGAARIFVMFNSVSADEPRSAVSTDEAMYALRYEANASLFVFDNFQFKDVVKGKVMGHTQKRIFPSPYYKPLPFSGLEYPDHDLARLAEATDGGVFTNKIKSSDVKALSTALADAILPRMAASARTCKRCSLTASYTGKATPLCTDDQFISC